MSFSFWFVIGVVVIISFCVASVQSSKDAKKKQELLQQKPSQPDTTPINPRYQDQYVQAIARQSVPSSKYSTDDANSQKCFNAQTASVIIGHVSDISPEYKSFLFEWQQELRFGHPNTREINVNDPMRQKLLFDENQLRDWSLSHLQDANRIMKDCLELMQNTCNPDVFFMRMDLLEAHARHLERLEKFMPLPSSISHEILRDISNICKNATSTFLKRSFYDVTTKAQSLKTENGKLNRYHKHFENLCKYRNCMSEENNALLDDIYFGYVGEKVDSSTDFSSENDA